VPRPRGHRLSRPAFDDCIEHAGLTLTQTADRADISRASLSALATGQSRASLPTVKQLADALGCRQATLFPTLTHTFAEVDG
jgi:transcriptional regulator with XRE-family HTH domain